MRFSQTVVIACLLGTVVLVAAGTGCGRRGVEQPISFNHKLHLEEVGLECTECHQYVTEAEYAGRPDAEICAGCHEEPVTDSAEEATLVEYIQSGDPIPWQRVYEVPSHVYYSHRRHVTVAGLECETCHGDIGQLESPPRRPLKKLTMGFCLDCHEESSASTDCNACHL